VRPGGRDEEKGILPASHAFKISIQTTNARMRMMTVPIMPSQMVVAIKRTMKTTAAGKAAKAARSQYPPAEVREGLCCMM
jgi:hypothetical protein